MGPILLALVLAPSRPLLVAHVMPWFSTKARSGAWGWHWTMNKTDAEHGQLASHYKPIGGAYDSSDPAVVERQLKTMKAAGFDGVLADWYGVDDVYDYAFVHKCTKLLFDKAEKLGLKVGVVYEDQTVPNIIRQGKAKVGEEVAVVQRAMRWLEADAFKRPNYLRWRGRPVFAVFGPQAVTTDAAWSTVLGGMTSKPVFLTLHHLKFGSEGGYGWPLPQWGASRSWTELSSYYERQEAWKVSMAVAYPRFKDYYRAAGVSDGYPEIPDDNGSTFKRTLDLAVKSGSPFIQVATWNDWGEGTQIEPSVEFGFRDLVAVLGLRKKLEPGFVGSEAEIRSAWGR
ncbi:MAG: hypothetical protein JSS65_14310 [Armatimonadetes bacterium]|nr:hypothetical protein [Armatimonadota bacterium]